MHEVCKIDAVSHLKLISIPVTVISTNYNNDVPLLCFPISVIFLANEIDFRTILNLPLASSIALILHGFIARISLLCECGNMILCYQFQFFSPEICCNFIPIPHDMSKWHTDCPWEIKQFTYRNIKQRWQNFINRPDKLILQIRPWNPIMMYNPWHQLSWTSWRNEVGTNLLNRCRMQSICWSWCLSSPLTWKIINQLVGGSWTVCLVLMIVGLLRKSYFVSIVIGDCLWSWSENGGRTSEASSGNVCCAFWCFSCNNKIHVII